MNRINIPAESRGDFNPERLKNWNVMKGKGSRKPCPCHPAKNRKSNGWPFDLPYGAIETNFSISHWLEVNTIVDMHGNMGVSIGLSILRENHF